MLENIHYWSTFEIPIIQALQSIRSNAMDFFFNTITILGDDLFIALLLPLLWQILPRDKAYRISMTFVLSIFINVFIKNIVLRLRPFHAMPDLLLLDHIMGYSFPSGHAQISILFWGMIAHEIRKRWFTACVIFLVVCIGLSRVYLGAHYPTDVLAGFLVGGALLGGYIAYVTKKGFNLSEKTKTLLGIAFVAMCHLYALSQPHATRFCNVLGVGDGIILGYVLGKTFPTVLASLTTLPKAIHCLLGVVGIITINSLAQGHLRTLPETDWLHLLLKLFSYFSIGLWLTFGTSFVLYIVRPLHKK